MRKNHWLLTVLTVVTLALALVFAGCKDTKAPETTEASKTTEAPETKAPETEAPTTEEPTTEAPETEKEAEVTVLGEGAVAFTFKVTTRDGEETLFEIHTDKETVGDALLELELIAGEESQYGLYVKEVNGVVEDYEVDGYYWAFFVNGDYAQTGVDTTPIEEGAEYEFRATNS